MTKTLTEQWREGTLRGCFYWKLPNGNICTAYTDTMKDIKNVKDSDKVEVLQKTPSYVEYNELRQKMHILEKKLSIATKELKEYEDIRSIKGEAQRALCNEIEKNIKLWAYVDKYFEKELKNE